MKTLALNLSGRRFRVVYRLAGDEVTARDKAADICLEQTVELAADLVPEGQIHDHILGRIESFERQGPERFEAVVSYAVETAGTDLLQLLNVIFGNISIKPGIRVEQLAFPDDWLSTFRGPRFGRAGLRERVGAAARPLLCAPLKPMGLPPEALAHLAYQLAVGGIDLIKDDHGLANQSFAPFRNRVAACAQAVARANRETGARCLYLPNVLGSGESIVDQALFAKAEGAGGLLVAPGLIGLDTMRRLADDDRIALPILSHPAFQGSLVTSPESGISHSVLFGQIARLAGADASIFPTYGGRFAFSRAECHAIALGTAAPMGHIKPIFPAPGGGLSLARIPETSRVYGNEVIFLIGGDLYRQGPQIVENCRYFRRLVETTWATNAIGEEHG